MHCELYEINYSTIPSDESHIKFTLLSWGCGYVMHNEKTRRNQGASELGLSMNEQVKELI